MMNMFCIFVVKTNISISFEVKPQSRYYATTA